jgi:hypothetical protein
MIQHGYTTFENIPYLLIESIDDLTLMNERTNKRMNE